MKASATAVIPTIGVEQFKDAVLDMPLPDTLPTWAFDVDEGSEMSAARKVQDVSIMVTCDGHSYYTEFSHERAMAMGEGATLAEATADARRSLTGLWPLLGASR